MTLVPDAGALIAVDRADRQVVALVKGELRAGRVPITHGGVVGQVWRDGSRRAALARLLAGVEIVALDDSLGRRVGILLARTGRDDVVDGAVAVLAADGDVIVASDTAHLQALAAATGTHVELVAIQTTRAGDRAPDPRHVCASCAVGSCGICVACPPAADLACGACSGRSRTRAGRPPGCGCGGATSSSPAR